MEDSLHFRVAGREDIPDLLRLYSQLDDHPDPPLDASSADDIWDVVESYPDYQIHLAESGGRVVGTFSLLVVATLSHRGIPSALVEAVVVDADRRGEGIGGAMMRRALDIARTKGCYKLALSSGSRRSDAHRFYDNLGFERHGVSFLARLEETDA
ncbi:MAG TPA: GNAT family N-acetyltransferase [Fibrobacteria bacterium]|nr:GNAT family N-acetyltransferase [Fibrobacteria bacterium]